MSVSPSDSPLIVEAKKKAKHLQSILQPQLPDISLGECLNFLSRLERERDWNTYRAKLKKNILDDDHNAEVDGYIKRTALPLIVSTAARHNLQVIADPSRIENGKAMRGHLAPRRLPLRIEPRGQQTGDTYCESFLDVSMTSLRIECDPLSISLNFVFPKEAFSVVAQLLSGDKVFGDAEPQVLRFESQQTQYYMLTVNTSGISDTADHGLSILTDPVTQRVLQKELDRFFTGYGRAVKTFAALQGRWGNKRLVTDFENSLWKLNNDAPAYMAASNKFYSTTIAGLQLNGILTSEGPHIAGEEGSVAIGVCSIIQLDDGEEGKPAGYYIAKYGDKWQTKIRLTGFTESEVVRVTGAFGIPQGRFPEQDTAFYQTPAFEGLCTWSGEHPQFTKRVGRNGGRYLPGWYDQVVKKKAAEWVQPTEQDFLNAIEKEPYLIDSGIRCSYHIDRKKTAAENKAIYHDQRDSFAHSGYREFSLCCEWLQGCKPRKTINTSISSYRLKHMVEAWARKIDRDDSYVSNGAFIAAAIHMGFDWKPDFDSPNVRFNISGKSPAIVALEGNSII